MASQLNIIIAGGKTGGHLFPGIATAQALMDRPENIQILFVGTNTPFEKETLKAHGFAHCAITAQGIKGRGLWQKIAALARLPLALAQSLMIMARFKPDVVLGVGGYAAGPVLAAAFVCGIPTAIQEQNTIPGMTNRLLARFVDKIFISFPDTRGLTHRSTTLVTGNPIRKPMTAPARPKADSPGPDPNRFILLVTGGSQGAVSINRAMVDALDRLKETETLHIIHQTGKQDEQKVAAAYRQKKISATVRAFFTDMPRLQEAADLIICRAGAGTLSEITALGKPAILIPYPHAADDHQRFNAMVLEKNGAARMIADKDLDGKTLAEAMEECRFFPGKLADMSRAARALGMPRARETVAEALIALTKKR